MANTQTSTSSRQGTLRGNARGKGGAQRSRSPVTGTGTVESDDTYGIVSVLYHALQGAETLGQYIEDAKAADNEQLVAFFEDCRAKQNQIALQGKRLLAEQLSDLAEDAEEEADDADDE